MVLQIIEIYLFSASMVDITVVVAVPLHIVSPVMLRPPLQKLPRLPKDQLADHGHLSGQIVGLPGLLGLLHVQSVNLEVEIVEPSNLEHEATVDNDERRMQFANWHVGQRLPSTIEDVVAEAVLLADGHRPETHVQHQVGNATRDHDFVAAKDRSVREFLLWQLWPLRDEARVQSYLQVLVRDGSLLEIAAPQTIHVR